MFNNTMKKKMILSCWDTFYMKLPYDEEVRSPSEKKETDNILPSFEDY